MTEQERDELLGAIYAKRGYLVIGTFSTYQPGDVTNVATLLMKSGKVPAGQPLRIVAETDRQDWREQRTLAENLTDAVRWSGEEYWPRFYRAESD